MGDAMSAEDMIVKALSIATDLGSVDGAHHKQWVIDQMVRALTGCPTVQKTAIDCNGKPYSYEAQGESDDYRAWVHFAKAGQDGPNTYDWDEGIPP